MVAKNGGIKIGVGLAITIMMVVVGGLTTYFTTIGEVTGEIAIVKSDQKSECRAQGAVNKYNELEHDDFKEAIKQSKATDSVVLSIILHLQINDSIQTKLLEDISETQKDIKKKLEI